MSSIASSRKIRVTVGSKSTLTVNFSDTKPNYFLLVNTSPSEIYMSAENIPNKTNYDCRINPSNLRMHAYIHGYTQIYLYNDSMEDAHVIITSFEWTFDPLILAQMEQQDLAGILPEISYDGIIRGHNVPLPNGNNTIGKVGFSEQLPVGSNKIGKVELTGDLPTGSNTIGKVGFSESLPVGSNTIGKVMFSGSMPAGANRIGDVGLQGDALAYLLALKAATERNGDHFYKFPVMISRLTDAVIKDLPKVGELDFFSNDSDTIVTLDYTTKDALNANQSYCMPVKPGETIRAIKFVRPTTITVNCTATGKEYRVAFQQYETVV